MNKLKFPTYLRKMWSGSEVQAWIDEQLAEQAEQEPVAWGWVMDGEVNDCIGPTEHARCEGEYTLPLYAAPVRTKNLTDDEIREAVENVLFDEDFDINIARAVIAADREKNK